MRQKQSKVGSGVKKGVLDRIRDFSKFGWNYTEIARNISGIKCKSCNVGVKEFFYSHIKEHGIIKTLVLCKDCFGKRESSALLEIPGR